MTKKRNARHPLAKALTSVCLWQRFACSWIVFFGDVLVAHQLLSFSQLHDPWSINKQWAAAVKKAAIVLALPIFLFDKENIITPPPHIMTFLIIERFTEKANNYDFCQFWCLASDCWSYKPFNIWRVESSVLIYIRIKQNTFIRLVLKSSLLVFFSSWHRAHKSAFIQKQAMCTLCM